METYGDRLSGRIPYLYLPLLILKKNSVIGVVDNVTENYIVS